MKRKKITREMWRGLNSPAEGVITNSHNLCSFGGGTIYISFTAGTSGRGSHPPKYAVVGIRFNTEPNGPWYNYGHKTWSGRITDKAVLATAQEWASREYGVKEWVRDPFGGWQDKAVMDRAVELYWEKQLNPSH